MREGAIARGQAHAPLAITIHCYVGYNCKETVKLLSINEQNSRCIHRSNQRNSGYFIEHISKGLMGENVKTRV